jgi:hypothetical protein
LESSYERLDLHKRKQFLTFQPVRLKFRTLAVKRLGNRLGQVTPEELALVLEGLDKIIGD